MSHNGIKTSRTLVNTMLSTKKRELKEKDLYVIDSTNNRIEIEQLKKANFTYSGAFPFLTNALSQVCTLNPVDKDGNYFIKRQDDITETHYSLRISWEKLIDFATGNEPLVKDLFRKEILSIFNDAPKLYIKLPNGISTVVKPFIISQIVYIDKTHMTKKEAEVCSRLGIPKKIFYIDIEFYKPLFKAALEKNNHEGFIFLDPAFYAKMYRSIADIQKDPVLSKEFNKFYNPKTKEFMKKPPIVYYKYFLYFLSHISGNPTAEKTTLNVKEMLEHVDTRQLDSKGYINNKFDSKLFMDKAGKLFEYMAKKGYCECVDGVPTTAIYHQKDDNFELHYRTKTPRTDIPDYTSNFISTEIVRNEALETTELVGKQNVIKL